MKPALFDYIKQLPIKPENLYQKSFYFAHVKDSIEKNVKLLPKQK